VLPDDTLCVRRGIVQTVEIGSVTETVPPGTFIPHCTPPVCTHVVVLVAGTELHSKMLSQWITFTQQLMHQFILQIALVFKILQLGVICYSNILFCSNDDLCHAIQTIRSIFIRICPAVSFQNSFSRSTQRRSTMHEWEWQTDRQHRSTALACNAS